MTEQILALNTDLDTRYPEYVVRDERDGYEGYLVQADKLIPFATLLRDELGYDFLSSVTGVDYLPDEKMEVVYHAYQSTGGGSLVFKVQVPRQDPVVPSLVPIYPGADLQEREAWDLLGISFEGHPDLRRILMWEGYEGHPLRKDWQEAYYEADSKPFKNRWPSGSAIHRIEDMNPFGKNVTYPGTFNPESQPRELDP
jgi:NADH-quinone oxidoreductase subunit D/NADH-quinone oxidoreductase subunit C/D